MKKPVDQPKTFRVKVVSKQEDGLWYHRDMVYTCRNVVTFGYNGRHPCYIAVGENGRPRGGIRVVDCVLSEPIMEYTMDELTELVGHEFTIKAD